MAVAIDPLLNQKIDDNFIKNDGALALLQPYLGNSFVLYFYPKDDTSGCTKQACELQTQLFTFDALGIKVVGVSKDSGASHMKFATKYGLTFPLISDSDGALCQAFDVWKEKSMYGKKYFGIERSTFYIDHSSIIRHIWRKVKVPDHWNEVLEKIK